MNYDLLQDDVFKSSTQSTNDRNFENAEARKKNDNEDPITEDNIAKLAEDLVRNEIRIKGIEAVVQECSNHSFLGKSKPKNPRVKRYVRDRSDKTPSQVEAMIAALEPGQKQLVKSKRIKLGKAIGLSESQIYKWYYDTYSRCA